MKRRVVAIVLPELACELAARARDEPLRSLERREPAPLAVIVDDGEEEVVAAGAVLHAVDARAWQFGARPGQTAAQAAAYVGGLDVRRVERAQVHEALGAVAEVVLRFGTTAGLELRDPAPPLRSPVKRSQRRKRDARAAARYPAGAGAGPYDTVWLDVSGCARLVGGEDVLLAEIAEALAPLGHRLRLALADGPRLAQAVARWAPAPSRGAGHVVGVGEGAEALAPLPIASLPLSTPVLGWFGKLGVLQVADLARLAPAQLSHRLGPGAQALLALVAGYDPSPLVAYAPPRRIVELATFDHELDGLEPILFVLRGLCARAAARLEARGEACSEAVLHLSFDPSYTRLQRRNEHRAAPPADELGLTLDLVVPLAGEAELLGAFRAKLEGLRPARSSGGSDGVGVDGQGSESPDEGLEELPIRGVRLELDGLVPRRQHQLGLGARGSASTRDPDAFPLLLAELGAWLGADRIGRLRRVDAHRPERRTELVSPLEPPSRAEAPPDGGLVQPCRLLPEPIDIGPLRPEGLAMVEGRLFVVDGIRLVERLDGVEWWSEPVRRDYYRVRLHRPLGDPGRSDDGATGDEHVEALVFLEGASASRAWLQGWFDG